MDKETTTKYIEAVGRRKTSAARVRIREASKASFTVNGRDAKEYFKTEGERRLILDPMIKGQKTGEGKVALKWNVEVHVKGGGIHSQSEAIRHGLSRALAEFNPENRGELKTLGFLK